MGFQPTPLTVYIDELLCKDAQWISDADIQCNPQPDVVGAKNVSILVANRTTPYVFYDVEDMYISQCMYGYYGLSSEVCLPCPVGALCPGGELFIDRVISLPGFWRD